MSAIQLDQGQDNQDFELNIVPIIDCFTVLIAYLLVSASFLSLAAFDVGVAVSGEAAVSNDEIKDPPYTMTVRLLDKNTLSLKLVGGKEGLDLNTQIPAVGNQEWDFKTLQSKLDEFKAKYPKLSEVNVNAEGHVNYKQIIRVVEKIKPAYSKVYLAGNHENQIRQ